MKNEDIVEEVCEAKERYIDEIFYQEERLENIEDFIEDTLDVSIHRIAKNIIKNCLIKSNKDTLDTIHELCIKEIGSSKFIERFKNNDFYIYFSGYMWRYMLNNFKLMNYISNTENKKELSFQKSLIKYNNELCIDKNRKRLENNSVKFSKIIENREEQNIFTKESIVKKNKAKVYEMTSNVYMYTLLNMSTNHISLDYRRKKWAEELLTFSFTFIEEYSKGSKFILNKGNYVNKIADLYFFERYYNYFFDISCLVNIEQLFNHESPDFKMVITNTLLPIVNLPNVFDNGSLVYAVANYISNNYYKNHVFNTRDIYDCIVFYDKIIIPIYNSLLLLVLNYIYKDKDKCFYRGLINYEKQFININSNGTIKKDDFFDENNLFGLVYPDNKVLDVNTFTNAIKYKYLTNNPYKDEFFNYIVSLVDERNNYRNTTIDDLKEYIDKYTNENKSIYDFNSIRGDDNKKIIEDCLRWYLF